MHYYMQYKDFTLNPYNFPTNQVKDFVTKLHNNGLQYGKIFEGKSRWPDSQSWKSEMGESDPLSVP